MIVILVLLFTAPASAQQLKVKHLKTIGKPNPPDKIKVEGAGHIDQIEWLDNKSLLIVGGDFNARWVRRVRVEDGKVLWEQRYNQGFENISLSGDKAELLVEVEPDPDAKPHERTLAQVLDPKTGRVKGTVVEEDIVHPTKRPADLIHSIDLYAGHRRGTVLAVFMDTEMQAAAAKARDELNFKALGGVGYGYRAYLIDTGRPRLLTKFKMDWSTRDLYLGEEGKKLGTVHQESFYIYDTKRKRDHIIAGKHKGPKEGWDIVIDADFYSGIQFSNSHAVITKDIPHGFVESTLIVVNMTTGKIQANQNTLAGHLEFDVDFFSHRIAMTGSSQDLAIYDFNGKRLAFVEDISDSRNHAIRFSPDGKRLAMGGWLNTIEIYSLSE